MARNKRKTSRTRVKAERMDYRTGGRVQYAVGRQVEGEPEKKPAPKPMQPVRKPIAQKPQKPVQPGIPVTGGGKLGSGQMPKADLPTGPAKAPVNTGRPIQRGDVGGITAQPAPEAPPGYIQKVGGGFEKIIPNVNASTGSTNIEKARELAQAGQQPAQPSPRMEREAINPATGKPYTPEEKRALNASIDQRDFKRSQTIQPTQAQISTQQYTPTQEDIQLAAQERGQAAATQAGIGTTGRDTIETDREGWWTQYGYGSQAEALQTGQFVIDPQTRQWVLRQDTGTTTNTTNQDMVDAKARAEQLAAGDMTGVPQIQTPEEVQVGDLGVAREMAPVTPIEAVTAKMPTATQPVAVAGVERVEAPTPLTPAEIEAARIEAAPEVAVAEGEVRPEAIAEAAQVERVAPIEGVKVEIVPGALTERVVGTLSPEAKAEAARVAGTTLARVTRAKKQLANAGLSEEQIQALGNDPEDLESRLMDLSEEERGIIEGLPEEALVSTQLNSLLAGIENGEIPTWARPAVASVEAMLAQRGLSASTVGRDALFNAIIQSAIPLAQSNAQAIQQSVGQQREIEARAELQDAQFRQQTALSNADKVFQLNLAQFSADQQTALSNSKFLQTVGLTEAEFGQQAIVQNAVLMSQANLAEADFYQKAQIQNAQAFLAMDMQNLNNEQQANVLRSQQEQQRLLSNQAAENAARQFNAASENQTQQFMTSLATQVSQYNATQANAMSQFNTQQINARQALEFQVEADLEKANAAMVNNINQFNSQMDFERDKFNVANAQAIEQSNLAWRRQVNTINTAAANQVAMQNAQNAFNMSAQAQSFLWQELRDQANYVWQSAENDENRKAQLYAQALANEGASAKDWSSNVSKVGTLINSLFGGKG